MKKKYYCCMCEKEMARNKRLVYQQFDNREMYANFHNKGYFDICDKCFEFFTSSLKTPKPKNGRNYREDRYYERKI